MLVVAITTAITKVTIVTVIVKIERTETDVSASPDSAAA